MKLRVQECTLVICLSAYLILALCLCGDLALPPSKKKTSGLEARSSVNHDVIALSQSGSYVNRCPPTLASYISPPLVCVNTAAPDE